MVTNREIKMVKPKH